MITIQDINKLRQQTGAGIMDCKKALVEAKGDAELAIEILRKKGQKIAFARAEKTTAEGIVLAKTNDAHTFGVIVALTCETDFVAKNEAFQKLGTIILEAAAGSRPATREQLLQVSTANGLSVQENIEDLVGKVGEKIAISAYETLNSETVVHYIHMNSTLGVLIGLQGGHGAHVIAAGKDVAMQIAAMCPLAVNQDGIDAAIVYKELSIAREQTRNENKGKPESILEKIAQGKLNKFFKEKTLLNQPFVKDNGLTVKQYLMGVAPGLLITDFKRVSVTSLHR